MNFRMDMHSCESVLEEKTQPIHRSLVFNLKREANAISILRIVSHIKLYSRENNESHFWESSWESVKHMLYLLIIKDVNNTFLWVSRLLREDISGEKFMAKWISPFFYSAIYHHNTEFVPSSTINTFLF